MEDCDVYLLRTLVPLAGKWQLRWWTSGSGGDVLVVAQVVAAVSAAAEPGH